MVTDAAPPAGRAMEPQDLSASELEAARGLDADWADAWGAVARWRGVKTAGARAKVQEGSGHTPRKPRSWGLSRALGDVE